MGDLPVFALSMAAAIGIHKWCLNASNSQQTGHMNKRSSKFVIVLHLSCVTRNEIKHQKNEGLGLSDTSNCEKAVNIQHLRTIHYLCFLFPLLYDQSVDDNAGILIRTHADTPIGANPTKQLHHAFVDIIIEDICSRNC